MLMCWANSCRGKTMYETIKKNLLQIQEDIAPCKPKIIAITKYFGVEAIEKAYEAGLRDFGESRLPQAKDKIQSLSREIRENSTFHFIGHLQTNKVKQAVGFFDYIHSVDSLKIAQAISRQACELGIVQKVLLQINNANEVQKFGFSKDELLEVFGEIKQLEGIDPVGVMNIAPLGIDEDKIAELFSDIVETKKTLETKFVCVLGEISMGMSQDYVIAANKGATMLRIGRKLFK